MRMFSKDVGNLATQVETCGPATMADDSAYKVEAEQSLESIIRLVQDEDYEVTSETWSNFLAMPEGSTVVYGRHELALPAFSPMVCQGSGFRTANVSARSNGRAASERCRTERSPQLTCTTAFRVNLRTTTA
jgi:hypothetical protein